MEKEPEVFETPGSSPLVSPQGARPRPPDPLLHFLRIREGHTPPSGRDQEGFGHPLE